MCLGAACTLRFCKCYGDDMHSHGPGGRPPLIPAKDIEGCWGCVCWPIFGAIEKKSAEGNNVLWHTGICCPLMLPYSDAWDRQPGTNVFVKRNDKGQTLEYKSPWRCMCLGLACTMKIC